MEASTTTKHSTKAARVRGGKSPGTLKTRERTSSKGTCHNLFNISDFGVAASIRYANCSITLVKRRSHLAGMTLIEALIAIGILGGGATASVATLMEMN